MNQPTEEQIDEAIDAGLSRPNGYFQNGFIKGVNWLLNWQKTQPLKVYVVYSRVILLHSYDVRFDSIFRNEKDAADYIATLDIPSNMEYYIETKVI